MFDAVVRMVAMSWGPSPSFFGHKTYLFLVSHFIAIRQTSPYEDELRLSLNVIYIVNKKNTPLNYFESLFSFCTFCCGSVLLVCLKSSAPLGYFWCIALKKKKMISSCSTSMFTFLHWLVCSCWNVDKIKTTIQVCMRCSVTDFFHSLFSQQGLKC